MTDPTGDGTSIPREHLEIFIAESEEQIDIWEEVALALEREPGSTDYQDALFRAVHTIKGSAGFVGCDDLKVLTHELETIIQTARDNQIEMGQEELSLVFDGLDATKLCIKGMKEDREYDIDYDSLLTRIAKSGARDPAAVQPESTKERVDQSAVQEHDLTGAKTYSIEIEITADESEAYLRGLLIQSKLEDVGEIHFIYPPLEDLRLIGEGFRFTVTVETSETPDSLRKAVDIDQATVISLAEKGSQPKSAEKEEQPDPAAAKREIIGRPGKLDEVVRVHVSKLESMMNLVGELVVANSRFISILNDGRAEHGNIPLLRDLEEKTDSLAKIARDLQDTVMKVSMLPVATIFSRFHRVVRDLAKHNGKEINLDISGEKTEIDKRIMDGISEPLIHLLRNAVDHGIEKTEDRVAFGKEAAGTIQISAYQEGDQICVRIADDGLGIDPQAVLKKAIEMGAVDRQRAAGLSKREVFDFLYVPRFSTASEVTDVSGRGMGLDIVKKTVEELGGTILIESTLGLGTTSTITLPLTTAIINALVVEAAGGLYAFPMSTVLEMIHPTRSELQINQKSTFICLRDEVITVLALAEVLWPGTRDEANSPDMGEEVTIIILEFDGRKIGMIVDALVGKQEIVVKSLSKNYRDIEGLIGATIMGSGRVALILEVKSILNSYYRSENSGASTPIEGNSQEIETPFVPAIANVEEPVVVAESIEQPAELDGSVDDRLYVLNDLEMSKMQEIMLEGAINSSRSMTDLLGHEVSISFPDLKVVPLDRITETVGGDEAAIAGIFVEFVGDITGAWIIMVPIEEVNGITNLLLGNTPGTPSALSETEISALKEMGNILASSFIRSMADTTDLDIQLKVPELTVDMCLAVMDSILVQFNQPGKFVMLTEAELFSTESQQAICQLFILMEHDSMAKLMQVLTTERRGLYQIASDLRRRYLSEQEYFGGRQGE